MKNPLHLLTASALLFLGACSSTYHAGTAPADDVYYSSKDYSKPATQSYPQTPPAAPTDYSQSNSGSTDQNTNQNNSGQDQSGNYSNDQSAQPNSDYSTSEQTQDGQGNTYITNNYYNDDDYYDYAYSARLRRYYSPVIGYSYYDTYYTNSYWYDYNPSSWGVSIYL
ncbi:MAG TPA: hypothetical protein PKL85_06205, partial [Bacteroidia bacterium]|nr:hypothetical protein [Bacteroidia bacterium]